MIIQEQQCRLDGNYIYWSPAFLDSRRVSKAALLKTMSDIDVILAGGLRRGKADADGDEFWCTTPPESAEGDEGTLNVKPPGSSPKPDVVLLAERKSGINSPAPRIPVPILTLRSFALRRMKPNIPKDTAIAARAFKRMNN